MLVRNTAAATKGIFAVYSLKNGAAVSSSFKAANPPLGLHTYRGATGSILSSFM
jgi:hypothetical protein